MTPAGEDGTMKKIRTFQTVGQGPYAAMFQRAFENLMESGASEDVLEAGMHAWDHTEIAMSSRMTRAAGNARYRRVPLGTNTCLSFGVVKVKGLKITLSTPLFGRIDDAEKFNTVSHEFAHIVDAVLNGSTNHGPRWKRLHRLMGGTGERCHNYDTSGLGRKKTRMVVRYIHTGREYRPGDRVRFRKGSGVVLRRMVKNLLVRTDDGREWRVPPSLLAKE
jgi:hypothetical protein